MELQFETQEQRTLRSSSSMGCFGTVTGLAFGDEWNERQHREPQRRPLGRYFDLMANHSTDARLCPP